MAILKEQWEKTPGCLKFFAAGTGIFVTGVWLLLNRDEGQQVQNGPQPDDPTFTNGQPTPGLVEESEEQPPITSPTEAIQNGTIRVVVESGCTVYDILRQLGVAETELNNTYVEIYDHQGQLVTEGTRENNPKLDKIKPGWEVYVSLNSPTNPEFIPYCD